MAQVENPINELPNASTSPQTTLPKDTYSIQSSPNAFGGLIAKGTEEIGQGATKLTDFMDRTRADQAVTDFIKQSQDLLSGTGQDTQQVNPVDGTPIKDVGYYGLRGQAAIESRKDYEDKLNNLREQVSSNLGGAAKLQYDVATRRMQAGLLGEMGRHYDQQVYQYGLQTNKASEEAAKSFLALRPADETVAADSFATILKARIKTAQIQEGTTNLPADRVKALATEAHGEVLTTRLTAMAGDPAQALAAQKLLDSEDEKGYANLVPVGLRNHIETQATQYIVQPKVQSALSVAFGGQAQTQQPAQDEQPSLHDASLTSTTTSSGAVLSQTQINAKSMKANLLDAEARGLATLQNDPELAANPTRLKVAEAQLKDTFQTLRYEQQSRQLQEAKAKDDMIIHFGNLIDKDPNANLLAQPGWSSLSPSQKENLLGYQQSAFQRKLFGGPNNPGPGYAEVTNLVRSGEITNPAQLMAQPGLKDKLTDWGVRSALEILKEWTAPGQEADKQRKTDLFSDIDNLVADGQNAKLDSSIGFRQSYMHSLVEAALLRGQTDGIPLSKLTNQQDKDSVWQTTIYPTMADPNFLSGAIFGPQGKNANAPAMPKPGTPAIQIPAPSFADPDGFKSLMKYSEGKVSSNGLAQAIQKMGPNPDPKTISQFNEAFAPFGYTWDIVKGYIQKKDIKDKNFQQMDLN